MLYKTVTSTGTPPLLLAPVMDTNAEPIVIAKVIIRNTISIGNNAMNDGNNNHIPRTFKTGSDKTVNKMIEL